MIVPVQLSVVVGVPKITPVAVHEFASATAVTFAGQVIVGFWVSFTVTVCVQVCIFPATSLAVQVTVVTPIGKLDGELLVTVIVPVQLSDVVGVPKTTPVATHELASATAVTFAGQVIVGFWVSFTVTVCVQVCVFPAASLAVQVTVVTPIGKLVGALLVTVIVPVQLSDVVVFLKQLL